MFKKILSVIIGITIAFTLFPTITLAAASFYEGKTVRIIVGSSAGGGFDAYARVIARHMGKHIPGHPTIIVENMTGAGGLIATNYLYRVAKPDGLTIGKVQGILFLSQAFGQEGIEFDARKFEYIGAAIIEDIVVALTKASGITSMDKWISSKTPVKIGGTAPGSAVINVPKILKAVLGLPIQVISGYKGAAEVRLAAEGGEIAGTCLSWDVFKMTWRKSLETGDVVIVLQATPKPFPDLPKVPLAIDLAKTEEARQLIELGIHNPATFARPFLLPPGTSKELVQILRNAFQATLKDTEFLAETKKAQMRISPINSEELEKRVAEIFKIDPTILTKLKEIILK